MDLDETFAPGDSQMFQILLYCAWWAIDWYDKFQFTCSRYGYVKYQRLIVAKGLFRRRNLFLMLIVNNFLNCYMLLSSHYPNQS